MAPPHYEIRVSGVLPPEALLDFEYLSASVEPVETVLYGELADLAALQGLLARLEAFGVNVLEVRRLRQTANAQSPHEQGPDEQGPGGESTSPGRGKHDSPGRRPHDSP